MGLLPAGEEKTGAVRKACIHELLAQTSIDGVEYTNPAPWFENTDGSLKAELYSKDGVHLSSEGYRVWSARIANLIDDDAASETAK